MAKLLKLLGVVQHQQQPALSVHRKVSLSIHVAACSFSLTAVYDSFLSILYFSLLHIF